MNNVKKPKAAAQAAATPSAKTLRNRRKRQSRKQRNEIDREEAFIAGEMGNLGIGAIRTRSGKAINPADPRTDLLLRELGQTVGGRQAALKILHPCVEAANSVTKIPDGAVSTSVVMERRDEFEIAAPADATTTSNYNVLVVSNPFLISTQMVIRWLETQSVAPGDLESLLTGMYGENAVTARIYPNFETLTIGTNTYDRSILQADVLSPQIRGLDNSGISTYLKSIRRTYMGVTTELNASDLFNQGRVITGQWTPDIALSVNAPAAGGAYPIYEMLLPALTSSTIVQSDEFCRQAEAKTGSYVPIRPCSPQWDFSPSSEWREVWAVFPGGPDPTPNPEDTGRDLQLRGWSIAVDLWIGIAAQSTLRIKRLEGLEIVPSSASTFSPFATPALPDDIRAKMIISEFARKQPHAFPADFNDLGEMVSDILGGLMGALGSLGLPVISPIATASSKAFRGDPLGDVFSGLVGSLF